MYLQGGISLLAALLLFTSSASAQVSGITGIDETVTDYIILIDVSYSMLLDPEAAGRVAEETAERLPARFEEKGKSFVVSRPEPGLLRGGLLEKVKAVVQALLFSAADGTTVTVYPFHEGIVGEYVAVLDDDRRLQAIQYISKTQATGSRTAIYDAVAQALDRVEALRRASKGTRKATIFLFTDGEENGSNYSIDQILDRFDLLRSDKKHWLFWRYYVPGGAAFVKKQKEMKRLAKERVQIAEETVRIAETDGTAVLDLQTAAAGVLAGTAGSTAASSPVSSGAAKAAAPAAAKAAAPVSSPMSSAPTGAAPGTLAPVITPASPAASGGGAVAAKSAVAAETAIAGGGGAAAPSAGGAAGAAPVAASSGTAPAAGAGGSGLLVAAARRSEEDQEAERSSKEGRLEQSSSREQERMVRARETEQARFEESLVDCPDCEEPVAVPVGAAPAVSSKAAPSSSTASASVSAAGGMGVKRPHDEEKGREEERSAKPRGASSTAPASIVEGKETRPSPVSASRLEECTDCEEEAPIEGAPQAQPQESKGPLAILARVFSREKKEERVPDEPAEASPASPVVAVEKAPAKASAASIQPSSPSGSPASKAPVALAAAARPERERSAKSEAALAKQASLEQQAVEEEFQESAAPRKEAPAVFPAMRKTSRREPAVVPDVGEEEVHGDPRALALLTEAGVEVHELRNVEKSFDKETVILKEGSIDLGSGLAKGPVRRELVFKVSPERKEPVVLNLKARSLKASDQGMRIKVSPETATLTPQNGEVRLEVEMELEGAPAEREEAESFTGALEITSPEVLLVNPPRPPVTFTLPDTRPPLAGRFLLWVLALLAAFLLLWWAVRRRR
ncbi:MAG: vWA domain-containing protein, partial [Bdellovibrionota bacterium]